jgi:pimeloyl-ACP methyl ester carboxylesterase
MNDTRRQFLTGTALAAAAAAAATVSESEPVQAQGRRKTYVLVHGAWHGGWCWRRVTPLLRAKGHDVFTPTLTGLGDRAHLARPDVGLETHIQDVIAMMEMEGLLDVTLVGHSYAGAVVQGVADRVPSRIARMVYLDAYVLENGKSLADYIPAERREGFLKTGEHGGFPSFPAQAFGVTNPDEAAWVQSRLVNQPYLTFTQKQRLSGPPPKVPHLYIACTQPAMGPFTPIAAGLRKNPAWKVVELKTGHDAMVIAPRPLAELLLAG